MNRIEGFSEKIIPGRCITGMGPPEGGNSPLCGKKIGIPFCSV